MEFLIELLLDLIFEGSMEISKNKKISKWIRYPIIAFIVLLFTIAVVGTFVLGILFWNENIYISILMIIIGIILLISGIIKMKKLYLERKEK